MELLPLIRTIGVVLYFFVAAQGAFYHVGFGKALFNISPESFIELRKAVDPQVRGKLKALYLSALATMFVLLILSMNSGGLLSYGPMLVAFLLLLADLVLIVMRSERVNELINSDC